MKNKMIFIFLSLVLLVINAQKTKNVIYITMDGYRWQELFNGADSAILFDDRYYAEHEDKPPAIAKYWHKDAQKRRQIIMPFVWNYIAKKGQIYGNRKFGNDVDVANNHHFSYPGYSELLCGFTDDQQVNSNDKKYNPNETVLEFINNRPDFKGKVAAFGSWELFPYIINDKRSGIPVNAGYMQVKNPNALEGFINQMQTQIHRRWSYIRYDAYTFNYAMEYLKREKPRLLYVSFGETDNWAHDGQYAQYLEAAQRVDDFIRRFWRYTQTDPQYKDKTTFILSCDHGRGGQKQKDQWKDHNNKTPGSSQTWMMVFGPDTPALGEIKTKGQLYNKQLPASLARFLAVRYDAKGKAAPAVDMFFIMKNK